jgi:hypothetical protein
VLAVIRLTSSHDPKMYVLLFTISASTADSQLVIVIPKRCHHSVMLSSNLPMPHLDHFAHTKSVDKSIRSLD